MQGRLFTAPFPGTASLENSIIYSFYFPYLAHLLVCDRSKAALGLTVVKTISWNYRPGRVCQSRKHTALPFSSCLKLC